MTSPAHNGWHRRDFLNAAGLLSLALGLPLSVTPLDAADPAEAPSPAMRALFRAVSQMVIPRTATPGAGDVGAGDFALLALAHGLDGSRRPLAVSSSDYTAFLRSDGSLRHADWLQAELDRRAGGRFLRAPHRAKVLAALDAEAYAEGVRTHPWRTIKGLILTGYYTSEAGGSQELRYELVPGRWDPDLPATPQTIAWSSDWTAVDFG